MANLVEQQTYDAGVYQLETTDAVIAGPGGTSNLQAQQLANRTAYLKAHVDALENGSATYIADSGAVNALVANFANPVAAYTAGLGVRIKVAVTNTGATTLAVNTLAATPIKKYGSADLEPGDLVAGDVVTLIYDGVNFQLQSAPHRIYGRKNYLINGNFDIWQRGITLSASVAGRYLADRWLTQAAGSTCAPAQQPFLVGQATVPNEPTYYHRTVVASVAGAGNYVFQCQKIESVRSLAGKTATLSFWARADAPKNMAVEFQQAFGTGGGPSAGVGGIGVTTIPLTATFQKFTLTVNLPSLSGITLGTNGDDCLILNFWFDAGTNFNSRTNNLGQQSGTFDIAQVQLEEGSLATQFKHRPIGEELSLCKRYFEIIKADTGALINIVTGMAYDTSNAQGPLAFNAIKRAIPAVLIGAANGFTIWAAGFTYPAVSVSTNVSWVTRYGIGLAFSPGTGLYQVGQASTLAMNTNGGAYISADAEL